MSTFAASRLVSGSFDEALVRDTATELRQQLSAAPSFALAFFTPDYAEKAAEFLELIRVYGHVPTVVGSSGMSLVGTGREHEEGPGFSLLFVSLPGGRATPFTFDQEMLDAADGPEFWHEKTGRPAAGTKAWLVFLNPFSLNIESWLKQWNKAFPGVPIFGGLASGVPGDPEAWVVCDDRVVAGGVALAIEGDIAVHAIVSQGCKPIGEPLTITQAERNVLLTLGSRPAYEVLSDVYQNLSDAEREQAKGHLFAGLAVSEYLEDYKRGDFLVRSIIGADRNSGAVAISALPRVGQTLQYQLRDSAAASDELRRLLIQQQSELPVRPFAGLLCTCNGRGRALFGRPDHDAGLVDEFFPGLPVAGFFANGEIGPVGARSFAHSHTASLALLSSATP